MVGGKQQAANGSAMGQYVEERHGNSSAAWDCKCQVEAPQVQTADMQ